MLSMEGAPLSNQWVLIREDFNVPMQAGRITDTTRIDAALETLRLAISQQAKVIVMSHCGRPEAGQFDAKYSLKPVADYLSQCVGQPVPLFALEDPRPDLQPGQIALLENVRFLPGEMENSPALAKQLAALCDVFVMDAFAVAHRAQASTSGVIQAAPKAVAGPLLLRELAAIEKIMRQPERPVAAIVGGAKVSTKLSLLENLLEKVDILVLGGGIANTFLAAQQYPVGDSLYEPNLAAVANALLKKAEAQHKKIWLPMDVVVASELSDTAHAQVKKVSEVQPEDKILDIGPASCADLTACLQSAKTILWNGPMGAFEFVPFAAGTKALALAVANSAAYTVAGGGDTLAAIAAFGIQDKLSYVSTGGGAFLESLEGKTLPAVLALQQKQNALHQEEV